jgi:hypothetical protein
MQQASIATRAKIAVEQALPILDRLSPLNEDVEAIKTIVRKQMLALVEELGPPRVSRVGQIFRLLGGADIDSERRVDADSIGGTLGTLRDQFGLTAPADFRIVADSIISLAHTWFSVRRLGRRH